MKAVELLNENMYNKLFCDSNSVPTNDALLIYKIYFQLIKYPIVKLSNNKEVFWKECCKYFMYESGGKTGNMITNSLKNMDLSNENIYQIVKLVGNNTTKINPNYFSRICGTTGLIVFFIKDVIDYLGLSSDKKAQPNRIYKTFSGLIEELNVKKEKLSRLLNNYYNIYF